MARRRGWIVGGLVVYALAAVAILVLPVSFSGIVHAISDLLADAFGLDWFGSGWVEFVANILLFVPLGFLVSLLVGRPVWGLLAGVALSVMAEVVQVVIPQREPTLRDILANAIGALIGAAVAWMLTRRRSPHPLDEALPEAHGVARAGASVQDPEH